MGMYYKRKWEERRRAEFDLWGKFIRYFEAGSDGLPTRKIELYENGNRLKYHSGKTFDDYGRLGDHALDWNDFKAFEIGKEEFELEWNISNLKKENQEIIDLISDYLANHYSQRFGQALFNLKVNEFFNNSNPAKEDYRIRDIHADADEKILERIRSQLKRFEEYKK